MSKTDSEQTSAGSRKAALAAFLVCVGLGPPLGSLPVSLTFALLDPANSANNLAEVGQMSLAVAFLAYILGGIPAILGGTGVALLIRRHGTVSYRDAAFLGVGSGAFMGIIMSLVSVSRGGGGLGGALSTIALLAGLAVMSALVCRWLLPRLGIIPGRTAGAMVAPRVANPDPNEGG